MSIDFDENGLKDSLRAIIPRLESQKDQTDLAAAVIRIQRLEEALAGAMDSLNGALDKVAQLEAMEYLYEEAYIDGANDAKAGVDEDPGWSGSWVSREIQSIKAGKIKIKVDK